MSELRGEILAVGSTEPDVVEYVIKGEDGYVYGLDISRDKHIRIIETIGDVVGLKIMWREEPREFSLFLEKGEMKWNREEK